MSFVASIQCPILTEKLVIVKQHLKLSGTTIWNYMVACVTLTTIFRTGCQSKSSSAVAPVSGILIISAAETSLQLTGTTEQIQRYMKKHNQHACQRSQLLLVKRDIERLD